MSENSQIRGGGGLRPAVRVGAALAALYLVQSAYLGAVASPSLFYVANLLAHYLGGLALTVVALVAGFRLLRARGIGSLGILAMLLWVGSVVAAQALVHLHNVRANRWLLILHVVTGCLAVVAGLGEAVLRGAQGSGGARRVVRIMGAGVAFALLIALVYPAIDRGLRDGDVIYNPPRPPFEMAGEAMGGAEGPFFPSSAETSTGGRIPSNFFMTSAACRRCHQDIYEQWNGSAHHFSSFNNQWYRKSIEYMQEVNSIESARWCGGCHDHAVLFNGVMDAPVSEFLPTEEAHTGLGCNSCHAITGVKGSMGNGGFRIEYPPLHDLAVSENPALRWLHDFVVQLDPGPHKQVFLKPFHREQTAEFCSSCHKVHLDEPVNNYRWLRGFNEYDNWQASGVSGQGARSFYYPPAPMDCADCHMPLVPSDDDGNVDGEVHDHSFPAANTALPVANLQAGPLQKTIEFLQRGQVTVDIFAAGPPRVTDGAGTGEQDDTPRLASTFAVGEEAATPVGRGGGSAALELPPAWAPLDRAEVAVQRGEEIRVDVVVRTRGVGHFFPGGTIDAFDVWLELQAKDETGRTIFWSGIAEDGGRGPVEEGAQFYGARMVDARGNRIDKRNAFATRAVAWINLIPPGAADVAHFRLAVPKDCGETIELEARLNYRKFSHANTMFSFAGVPADGEPAGPGSGVDRVGPAHDDRRFVAGEVPENVSAELREIPTLPIVVMHQDHATLRVVDSGSEIRNASPEGLPHEYERWNDYGIGLLRQGDFQGARRAFGKVTELDPGYADGWVNRARVALQEGLLDEAAEQLTRSLEIEPELAKSHYFLGVALNNNGKNNTALEHMRRALAQYPRDRVVRNGIARILFLQRDYEASIEELQQVLAIDPEDLMAHYNLMLCYRGLGRTEEAEAERKLYERFKADEDAQVILGPYLRENPGDNRMRQPILEQVSAPAEMIARELEIRELEGDRYVVLPGMAEEYARRVVERGERMAQQGASSERHRGPTEAPP